MTALLLRRTHHKAMESVLVRQREALRSRFGAGWEVEQAFNLARWNRELEQTLVEAGMSRKQARKRAQATNEDVLARLRMGQTVSNIYASLIQEP